MMSAARFSRISRKPVPQENILAAADGRAGGGANVAHGVDVFGRDRFLQPHQLERLHFLGDALAGGRVVAPVHVHGEIEVLRDKVSRVKATFATM